MGWVEVRADDIVADRVDEPQHGGDVIDELPAACLDRQPHASVAGKRRELLPVGDGNFGPLVVQHSQGFWWPGGGDPVRGGVTAGARQPGHHDHRGNTQLVGQLNSVPYHLVV
jgi:hypothetical protein